MSVGKFSYSSYKLFDALFDAGRAVWSGVGTVTRTVSKVSVVMDGLFLPLDLFTLVKASYDVHVYKTTGQSNSNCAQELQFVIDFLEDHEKKLLAIREEYRS
jgi:hypothetical protein